MEFNDEQVSIIIQKSCLQAMINQQNNENNYVDNVTLNIINIMSGIEELYSSDYKKFFKHLNTKIIDSFVWINATDFADLLKITLANYKNELSTISGLFKAGKIKNANKKIAEQFLKKLEELGGIDAISENYAIPFLYEKYKDIVDFGF